VFLLALIGWAVLDDWFGGQRISEARYESAEETVPPGEGPRAPSADLTRLFSASDYPVEAIRKEEQGTTVVRLDIDEREEFVPVQLYL
jgi:outer membrane biosynthesis protein TonB